MRGIGFNLILRVHAEEASSDRLAEAVGKLVHKAEPERKHGANLHHLVFPNGPVGEEADAVLA